MSRTQGGGHKRFWGKYLKQNYKPPSQSHHSSLSLSQLVVQPLFLKDIKDSFFMILLQLLQVPPDKFSVILISLKILIIIQDVCLSTIAPVKTLSGKRH